eukprot:gene20857-biopygen80970
MAYDHPWTGGSTWETVSCPGAGGVPSATTTTLPRLGIGTAGAGQNGQGGLIRVWEHWCLRNLLQPGAWMYFLTTTESPLSSVMRDLELAKSWLRNTGARSGRNGGMSTASCSATIPVGAACIAAPPTRAAQFQTSDIGKSVGTILCRPLKPTFKAHSNHQGCYPGDARRRGQHRQEHRGRRRQHPPSRDGDDGATVTREPDSATGRGAASRGDARMQGHHRVGDEKSFPFHFHLIPRISNKPGDMGLPVEMVRRQFPARLAYGASINKAQAGKGGHNPSEGRHLPAKPRIQPRSPLRRVQPRAVVPTLTLEPTRTGRACLLRYTCFRRMLDSEAFVLRKDPAASRWCGLNDVAPPGAYTKNIVYHELLSPA